MVKVKSISDNGVQINCSVEYASLNEAFKELHIDASWQDSIKSVQSLGLNVGDADLTFNFLNNTTLIPGFKINGVIKLNYTKITIKYDRQTGSLLPKYVLIKSDFNTDGSNLSLSSNGALAINAPELKYANFPLPDFYIRVPILLPVIGIKLLPIRCVQKVSLWGGPITMSGKAKWDLLPKIISVMGAEYKDGSWNNISTFSVDAAATPLLIGNFNPAVSLDANFTMIRPVYEFSPYGADVLKVSLEAPYDLSFKMQLQSPNYSLKTKLSVKAGITAKWFDGTSASFSLSRPISEKTLLEGDWIEPVSVAIVSGNNQIANLNTTLPTPLVVVVKDINGNPMSGVGVKWASTAGGGQLTPDSSVTNPAGQASTSWKLGAIGSQSVSAIVKKSNGTNVMGSPLTFIASAKEPNSVTVVSGNNQNGAPNANLANPLVVEVKDVSGVVMNGVTVFWNITAGGGQVTTVNSTTDASGRAFNSWKLGTTGTQSVTATVKKSDGLNVTGSPLTFVASIKTDTLALLRSKTWRLSNASNLSSNGISCGGTFYPSVLQSAVLTFGGTNANTTYSSTLTGLERFLTGTTPCWGQSNKTVIYGGKVDVNLPELYFNDSHISGSPLSPLFGSTIVSLNETRLVLNSGWYSGQLIFNAQ